jgi:hypothetical protein
MAVLLRDFDVHLVPGQDIQMTTGATIHTLNGLFMTVTKRNIKQVGHADDMQPVWPTWAVGALFRHVIYECA